MIGVSVKLIEGIRDLWIALREPLPRPLCPKKFFDFAQKVKAQYLHDLPWMKDSISPTLHKICDHPKKVLERLPDTLRISMLSEEPIEGNIEMATVIRNRFSSMHKLATR